MTGGLGFWLEITLAKLGSLKSEALKVAVMILCSAANCSRFRS